jgi:RNA polymerase sigma factor (sigma-70 family)
VKGLSAGGDLLQDEKIIELYFARDEQAIKETDAKYGAYCFKTANNILANQQDSEECVNDTWLRAWNVIPPTRPKIFSAFLSKITRNLALNRFNYEKAKKRNFGVTVALEELSECVGTSSAEKEADAKVLEKGINEFLKNLPERERNIFIRRYFFAESTETIGERFSLKDDNVLKILSRTRQKLKTYLVKEGLTDD